ncbi:alpha/beta hydrolase [Pseudoalteromonas sp. MMG010]|uniref:alpha/beta fold hydrolase n=1 Tax=Pseudoalteromonas sp. MMG010 TaxID=2822685 RepID=UPI001B3A471F|nr:alpha/beta hydrolase [Pseudoalteromonas sp. MMG010]MBQ4832364.1 alpha/beta hydrolase [Pseudoalteromonas sp. MMG010]
MHIPRDTLRSNPVVISALLFLILIVSKTTFAHSASTVNAVWPSKTSYHYVEVYGKKIFYREAGKQHKQTIVLLHGYPASSHSYRELIPLLSGRFHVIAPDYLGSGYSARPDPNTHKYTFDLLAKYTSGLLKTLKIDNYSLYMQDFGAPVGYKMLLKDPNKLEALIVQNANAYLAGLTPQRQQFFKQANLDKSNDQHKKLYSFTSTEAIINKQYLRDVQNKPDIMSPDSWTHDLHFLSTESDRLIQVQLFKDYYNNLLEYPKWQAYLRQYQPPTLIVWGKNDPAFIAPGAKAYLQDVPKAQLHLLDAGHFSVEEKPVEIAQYITEFLLSLKK